jgi:signal transduction histidine kinase
VNTPRRPLSRLGIPAFVLLLGGVVAVMLWGLITIDALLARVANDQRQAIADYMAAMMQTTMGEQGTGNREQGNGEKEAIARRVEAAAGAAMRAIRREPRAVAVTSGADTLVVPDSARRLLGTVDETLRPLRLPDGRQATLHVLGVATTRGPRSALWVVGVLSIILLGLGVARERHQSLQVAARSSDVERLSIEALRANAMKSEFLANVSHELRTPLTAIVGFVEMLRDGVYGELAPRQVGPVDRIAASATHLRHLVDQILDIARIAAGRLEVSREVISLRPYVLNIASELESLFNERSLRLSISVPTTLPKVRTDPTHLRHILVNLLGNAVKYTPSGGVAVRARLLTGTNPAVRRTPDDPVLASTAPSRDVPWIALQVVDTGVGVAERDRERIFDEFEQVNAGPRTDSVERGTGLGLAISRRLARSLGGDITVESQAGKGSTFTMWIPVDVTDLIASEPVPAAKVKEFTS